MSLFNKFKKMTYTEKRIVAENLILIKHLGILWEYISNCQKDIDFYSINYSGSSEQEKKEVLAKLPNQAKDIDESCAALTIYLRKYLQKEDPKSERGKILKILSDRLRAKTNEFSNALKKGGEKKLKGEINLLSGVIRTSRTFLINMNKEIDKNRGLLKLRDDEEIPLK